MLTSGNATINPEICGFLKDNQLANEIIMLDIRTLTKKLNINQLKKFFIQKCSRNSLTLCYSNSNDFILVYTFHTKRTIRHQWPIE